MSEPNPRRCQKGWVEGTPQRATPSESARVLQEIKREKQSAAYQINPDIREATPTLLAQHILEIDAENREAFLAELIQQLRRSRENKSHAENPYNAALPDVWEWPKWN